MLFSCKITYFFIRLSATDECTIKNSDVDNDLKNILVKYQVPYNVFKDIKKIGNGGFATVFCARWHTQNVTRRVALKVLHGSSDCHKEFMKEVFY